ncbi:MAG: FAD-dependent monooxygenase [Alphaproteobacteria bacterium]
MKKSPMNQLDFDITIIGSSFAGMTSALALAKISPEIKIAIIDKLEIYQQQRPSDGRAFAISKSSLKLFEEINIYQDLIELSGKITDIKITDYKSPFILDFLASQLNDDDEKMGLIIENHFIFEALKKQILLQKNITIFSPNFYQEINFLPNFSQIILNDNKILNAKLILACDGRFSKLRELYQIKTEVKNYHQIATVFKISHQIPHKNTAFERFISNGPLAILPLQNPSQSSIVWINNDEFSEVLHQLDEENFLQQLHKKSENCLGKMTIISKKFTYPLNLVLAEKFYHQKILFIGDSACGIHPIAGQGYNLAINGIKILQKLIAQNILNGLAINDDNLILQYHQQARADAKKMAIATDLLNNIFESQSLLVRYGRNIGLGVINLLPNVKKFFIAKAGGLK